MPVIYSFSNAQSLTCAEAGGKAFSLIRMVGQGLPVPPGLVLTTHFFKPWLDTLQSSPEWAALRSAAPSALGPAAQALWNRCRDLAFTPAQQAEWEQALREFETVHPGRLFAVRSSSQDEDLESTSFAGGYETTLGVAHAALEAAIRHSFASCCAERVILYKKERGLAIEPLRMAVIVQQQLDADSAGVAFSVNPLNNCYDEALINANYGLGESVVSGAVEPDTFVVDRVARRILETRAGGSGAIVRLNPQGGTLSAARPAQAGPCLTPDQALLVAALLDPLENLLQAPVDIEWAFAQGRLYLLQARPITTYLPLPDEMLTAPGAPRRLYANSALIEQGLQEPLSVLGTDFLAAVLAKAGGPVAEGAIGLDGITFTAGGGYYMNISYAFKSGMRSAALAPGSVGDPRVTAILDGIDMRQYLAVELPPKLKAMRGKLMFVMLPMAVGVLSAYLRPERILRRYQAGLFAQMERFKALSEGAHSLQALANRLTAWLEFFYGAHGIPMILAAQIAQQRIKHLFQSEAGQVQDLLAQLGVALPGNKTAEMGAAMLSLAASAEIRGYDSAGTFMADLQAGLFSEAFQQRWNHFLEEFGMRCPGEIDPATPRPYEQPARFFDQLKSMSPAAQEADGVSSFFGEARAKREAAYQDLYEIALKKGKRQARRFQGYYQTWLRLGGYRETPKHYVIQVVAAFRRRALRIGQQLVAEGRLDRAEQIFDLTIADIDRAQGDPLLDLRALARERTRIIEKIRKSHLVARIIDSRGKIYFPPPAAHRAGELSGVPISPGVVQGRVKVLQSAAEKELRPGEILVARATDPGWTPLFINAAGIILEIGGALQHGAVVAREYGIPCVSGVDDVTSRLKDGQIVEVDGSNGVIRILAG